MTSSGRLTPSNCGEAVAGDSIARDAFVEIDFNFLESNLQIIRANLDAQSKSFGINSPQIMAVVKADAYGHGAVRIAEVLSACGVGWLGVASADEAIELRSVSCRLPILILGPTPFWAAKKAIDLGIDLTVSSLQQLQEITKLLKEVKSPACIHLKVDTGMHRLGMNIDDAKKAVSLIKENKKIKLVSVYSHLAKSLDAIATEKQTNEFRCFIDIFKKEHFPSLFFHLAASEAARNLPSTYFDMVRIGIELYGLQANTVAPDLMPIMSIRGRINQINNINEGESVGYGFTWKALRPTRLANIPIGYADGLSRNLSNKMQGILHHQLVKQVGTISMDQMLFDVTDVPLAKEGDVITLIGGDEYNLIDGLNQTLPLNILYLAEWAKILDTITYELACRMKVRLPRIYTRQEMSEKFKDNLSFNNKEKDKK